MDSRGKAGFHVIFGTGPVGSAAARFLLQKGLPVRLVSRSGRRPAVLFDGLPVDQERAGWSSARRTHWTCRRS